jgi:hypothetical protein
MKFHVGDTVKLTNYYRMYDHSLHVNETATICEVNCKNWINFNCKIKWKSGAISLAPDYDLILVRREVTMDGMKFGIKYETDEDPIELFATRAEAIQRIEELLEDDDSLDKDSIYLFEIGKVYKGQVGVTFTEKR